nr:MAG TPA_asm: catabolite gene activator protein [Caudoviricetes sp.]
MKVSTTHPSSARNGISRPKTSRSLQKLFTEGLR